MADCLIDLFGITRQDCDCFTEGLLDGDEAPAEGELPWYKKSISGLFLDEVENIVQMISVENAADCDKTIGAIYREAREVAIKRTRDDVFTVISERFKSKRETFSGRIGGVKFDRGVSLPNAGLVGVVLSPKEIVDGVFKLKSLTIASSVTNANLDVYVYKYHPETGDIPELIETLEIVAVAGKSVSTTLDEILELPNLDGDKEVEYFLLYELADGQEPKNTSTSCGCGRKEHLFNTYAKLQGIAIDEDSEDLTDFTRSSQYSYGLTINGDFTCIAAEIICRMYNADDAWATVIAYAARYLAASIVMDKILRSNEINRDTMAGRESIAADMANYRTEYWDRVQWLAQNTDPSISDCYECLNKLGLRKVGIKA